MWCEKDAENSQPTAQYMIARMYWAGQGVAKDHSRAVFWCRKVAEHGLAEAMIFLANMYYDGRTDAQYQVARSLYFGKGVEANFNEALIWCRKALFQMHPSLSSSSPT